MYSDQQNSGKGLLRGVLLTQVVLMSHVVLLALIGVLVLFLGRVSIYFIWILLGGALLTAFSAYLLYRRIKSRGRRVLQEMMNSPVFKERDVEVSILGGMASMKFGRPNSPSALESGPSTRQLQLEDPDTVRIRELSLLADLLEKQLITSAEFEQAKHRLLGHDRQEGQKP
jgi:hypothetical protein